MGSNDLALSLGSLLCWHHAAFRRCRGNLHAVVVQETGHGQELRSLTGTHQQGQWVQPHGIEAVGWRFQSSPGGAAGVAFICLSGGVESN